MLMLDESLARRLELHQVAGMIDFAVTEARVYPEVPAATLAVGGGTAVYTGPGMPLNRAIGMGMTGPVTPADLDALEAFYRERSLPSALDLCPLADPSLRDLLNERGYRIKMFFNVYVRPLTPGETFAAPAPGVTVKLCRTPEERQLWADTISRGFGGPNPNPAPAGPSISHTVAHRDSALHFIAYVDGLPAGGAALDILDGKTATMFSATTWTEFRNRGVQTALLQARLAEAAARGCDLAHVLTTPGTASQRNVLRAGFQVAYTKLTMSRELA